LFKKAVVTSRKNNTQKAFEVLAVDLFVYDVSFQDKKVFGSLATYTYEPFSIVALAPTHDANGVCDDVGERCCQLPAIANVDALKESLRMAWWRGLSYCSCSVGWRRSRV
jgi:hypothetical protein